MNRSIFDRKTARADLVPAERNFVPVLVAGMPFASCMPDMEIESPGCLNRVAV